MQFKRGDKVEYINNMGQSGTGKIYKMNTDGTYYIDGSNNINKFELAFPENIKKISRNSKPYYPDWL